MHAHHHRQACPYPSFGAAATDDVEAPPPPSAHRSDLSQVTSLSPLFKQRPGRPSEERFALLVLPAVLEVTLLHQDLH